MPIMFSVGGVNALAGVSHSVRAPSKQWRTLHEILGGASARGLVRFICMSVLWLGDPGACSHRKILKTTILETPFLAFWGHYFTEFPRL